MAGMADQQDVPFLIRMAPCLDMDLRDKRAGGVNRDHLALARRLDDGAGNTMRRKHHRRTIRNRVKLLDEYRPFGGKAIDNGAVVNNLVPDIDGSAELFQCHLDNPYRTVNTGAKATWRCQV
jgi:hypothetical protein